MLALHRSGKDVMVKSGGELLKALKLQSNNFRLLKAKVFIGNLIFTIRLC
jgi:hypothetical protein